MYHGTQRGRVALAERQLGVTKPRLRKRQRDDDASGEVEVPAYTALQKDGRLADRILEIVLAGISTRRYEEVLPQMAETVGISKSQVSREFIEAGERLLKALAERDFSQTDMLAVYVDGLQFGGYHIICVVGVDSGGHKHVHGFREGATENAEVGPFYTPISISEFQGLWDSADHWGAKLMKVDKCRLILRHEQLLRSAWNSDLCAQWH